MLRLKMHRAAAAAAAAAEQTRTEQATVRRMEE